MNPFSITQSGKIIYINLNHVEWYSQTDRKIALNNYQFVLTDTDMKRFLEEIAKIKP